MLDVHPPHQAAHTWKDFFIHIATICVGLLIAIGLEQSVEALHHHHQREYLEDQMHRESERNLQLVTMQLQYSAARHAYLDACIHALQSATAAHGDTLVTLPADRVALPAGSGDMLISPSRGTWTVATAGGTVALLPPETAKVYARLDLAGGFEQAAEIETGRTAAILASTLLRAHVPPNHTTPLRLTQSQVDDLLYAYSQTQQANDNFHFRLAIMQGALEAIIDHVDSLEAMYPYQQRAIEQASASSYATHPLVRDSPLPAQH